MRWPPCMGDRAMPAKSQPADAVPVFHFSTDAFPERERLSAWREIFGRTVVNLNIEPLSPEGFHARATVCQLPGLGVLYAASAAVRLTHSRDLIVDNDLSFMAAPTCPYEASQHGRNPVLGPGESVLMNNAEVGSMSLASASQFTTFRVPAKAIASLVPDIGAAVARAIPAGNAALKLLVGYLASALDTEALMTPELQQLAVTHVHDLLALALGATREAAAMAAGRGVRAARLRAAKDFIMQHLGAMICRPRWWRRISASRRATSTCCLRPKSNRSPSSCSPGDWCARNARSPTRALPHVRSAPSPSTPGSATCPISIGLSAGASAARLLK
jgi:hypothetical protein